MSKKRIVFTDTLIRKLKPEEKKFTRSEGNGFSLRVLPAGTKTWLYIYELGDKRREMSFGNYPFVSLEAAREKFEAARKQVKAGIDPQAVEPQSEAVGEETDYTVEDLVKEYIEKHAMLKKRGWKEDQRILNKDALPAWGQRKASDIKKRDVVLLLEKIMERGSPGSANGNYKCLRKMFSYAVEKDILEYSPCTGVKMPAPINRGDRVLTEKEVKLFWDNVEICNASSEIKRALKLQLITGQRSGEVIGMHTREIDGRWWTIPAERSKNKLAHRVYLTAMALELIGSVTEGFIFPCPHKKKIKPISPNAVAHAVRNNLEWEEFVEDGGLEVRNLLGIAKFTPHDLRRTAATGMSHLGVIDAEVDAVLNHVKQGVIRTYNLNKYDKEKQAALEAWETKLRDIVGLPPIPVPTQEQLTQGTPET